MLEKKGRPFSFTEMFFRRASRICLFDSAASSADRLLLVPLPFAREPVCVPDGGAICEFNRSHPYEYAEIGQSVVLVEISALGRSWMQHRQRGSVEFR